MPRPTDPVLERMLAILERLSASYVDGQPTKKKPVLTSPETEQAEMEPGGYPRPYVS